MQPEFTTSSTPAPASRASLKPRAEPGPHSTVRRDIACVLAVTVFAAVLCVRFDVGEKTYSLTRRFERFQLDEFPLTLVVLALGLAWFAWRRYRESQRELLHRRALEEQAERLLADNRRLASESISAQENERRHLARELHDELGQYLNAIALDAGRIRDLSAQGEPDGEPNGKPEVHRLSLAVMQSASTVYRQIGGMIRRLRPIGLDEFGLPSALEHCVESWRERLPQASFTLTVDGDFSDLADVLNITLYRLVQEGLTNVSKFARAARVEIYLVRTADNEHDEIMVTMTDDGPGIDLSKPRAGLGLIGMRERVEAIGGEFHIASQAGSGFLFCARVPVPGQSQSQGQSQAALPGLNEPSEPAELAKSAK